MVKVNGLLQEAILNSEKPLKSVHEENLKRRQASNSGPWTNDIIDENNHYVTVFTIVTEFTGEPQLLEPHKCEGWRWFSSDELPSPLFTPISNLLRTIGIDGLKRLMNAHLVQAGR